jgi:5-formyltetrahydrofolate cyclo-ligase
MIPATKKTIRDEIKKLKSQITVEEKIRKSAIIFELLENDQTFLKAETIMAYWSMTDEVQTHNFILKWAGLKRIILPSVDGENLQLKEFKGIENLTKGSLFGIPEPYGLIFEYPELIELVIVPGIAFDVQNNRMGRGKAYYDKLLVNLKAYKIGVCFDFQLFEQIPTDEFDIKMDRIIFG